MHSRHCTSWLSLLKSHLAVRVGLEDSFGWIIWEAITITSALNGGLSMANKQYHRLLLRSSEGTYIQVPLTPQTLQGYFKTLNFSTYKINSWVTCNLNYTLFAFTWALVVATSKDFVVTSMYESLYS